MSELLTILSWIGLIALTIKGLITLWFVNCLLAIGVFILLSPVLPVVGFISFCVGK